MLPKTADEFYDLDESPTNDKTTNQGGVFNDNAGQVIVMGFMKNAIVNNPIIVSTTVCVCVCVHSSYIYKLARR